MADFNQTAQEQFVLDRETALGTPLKQLLGNPILVSKALEKSTVEPVEVTLAPSGTERIYLVKSSSLEQLQGQALGHVTVWHDITEWREAERSLQENESFLRQVIDSNPHHISVKHREGRFLLVNKAKATFHGLPVESFVGETAHLFLNDATKAEEQTQADLEVITQDNTKQFPAVAATHGVTGETHWFETTVTPLKGTDGTPLGVLSIETDISNLKRYEQNIDRQVRFEQLINRISGEFINQEPGTFDATIATALGAIAGFMEADRGGIMRLDDEQASITCTHEWSGTGIKLQFPQSSPLDLPQKLWWLHRLRADETVFIPHLDQLPPSIRSSLQAEEARSLVHHSDQH